MRENAYQASLIKRLRELLPGCFILKNDSGYMQGVPDLLILHKRKWAMLEVKASEKEPYQPNQEWYIDHLDGLSFCRAIHPQNEEDVLRDLQQALVPRRASRLSQSQ